ncbi:MAG: hypothetical protein CVV58_06480 [Tenericutes bacterium HGW-Tenericutes-3]|nr:MAG: hypothetical protein CVV58_06480 [Tenericutes bacterium HGW-Tenericutes-3]
MILDANLDLMEILVKILLPLSITFLIGSFIGLERQNVGKAAGLSAHVLVAMGAAGIAIMQRLMFEYQIDLQYAGLSIDPEGQRVIAQVITGIGFVGAGVIIKDQTNVVKGITTAATLWFMAMIGLILGSGYILLGTILGLFISIFIAIRDLHRGFNPFKGKPFNKIKHKKDSE